MEDDAGIDGEETDLTAADGCAIDAVTLAAAKFDNAEVEDGKEGVVDAAEDLVCGELIVEGGGERGAGVGGVFAGVDGAGCDVSAGGLEVGLDAQERRFDADSDAREGGVCAVGAGPGRAAQVEPDMDWADGEDAEGDTSANTGGPEV